MPQHRLRQRLGILKTGMAPALHQRPGLYGRSEAQGRAGTGSELHRLRRRRLAGVRGVHDPGNIIRHHIRQEHPAHQRVQICQCLPGHHRMNHRLHAEFTVFDDLLQRRGIVAADFEFEQKTVHLRFRQRIGAFQFDGVLGGEDKKRIRQHMGLAEHRDPAFLHRLQQGALRFRAGPVDFIRQHQIGKNRTRLEHKCPALGRFLEHRIPRDIARQQVGSKLDTFGLQLQGSRQPLHQFRLAQTRQAFQQNVSPCQQPADRQVDQLLLPEQHLLHRPAQRLHRRCCRRDFRISRIIHNANRTTARGGRNAGISPENPLPSR